MARARRTPDPGAPDPGTRLLALLLGIAAAVGGCMLPPQAEEVPLTGALEAPARRDVAPREAPAPAPAEAVSARAGDLAASTDEPVDPPRTASGATAEPIAIVSVQESAAPPLERVGEPDADIDLQAIERDGGAELRSTAEADLVPAEAPEGSAVPAAAGGGPAAPSEVAEGEPASFRVRSVETSDGLRMVFRVGGAGPPLVLVHGWCGNASQWDEHTRALAASHRVYAVDLPGHGDSRDQVRASWTIPAFGDDVARLIESEKLQDVVIVGHAMGGQVALEAAAAAPGRVDAVIGVDSLHRLAVNPNPERLEPYLSDFADDYAGSMAAFIDEALPGDAGRAVRARILDDALACSPEVAVALMRHFGVHDPKFAARTIECRVVCINSDGAPTDVEGNRALLTSFDASIMKGVGHWPHLEAPQDFQGRLRAELARLGPPEEEGAQALLQSLSPVLYCEDVAAARVFYVDGLAFEETDRLPRDESLAPDFVALRRDDATLMLQSLATLRSDLPEVAARPRDGVLFLRVTNLDKELLRLGEGAKIAVPERKLSSGSRQIVVEDPAGNFVVLQQAPAVPAR